MAQRVLGIDLGAHSVKVVEMEVGFRASELLELRTITVPRAPGGVVERALQALDIPRELEPGTSVAVGMPGDRVLLRLLDIPAVDARKRTAIVANELADDLPWEIDEVVFAHAAIPPAGEGKPHVLAAVAHVDEVRDFLGQLAGRGLDPRVLPVASLAYAGLVRRLDPEGTLVVVDVGHERTNVCLVSEGRALLGRTISRAGHHVTEALRRALQLSYHEAEAFKERRGLVAARPDTLDGQEARIAEIVGRALAPLARDLRLTLEVFAAQSGRTPARVLLCGGSALLRGMDTYLQEELGLPVERLQVPSSDQLQVTNLTPAGAALGALSLGLALGEGRQPELDLRQGPFAYKADRSIFREKILGLSAAAVVILICAALASYARLYALRQDEAALRQELRRETRVVFGRVVSSPRAVVRRLKRGAGSGELIPEKTAVDILDEISRRMPPRDQVQVDVNRLDIRPGKTFMSGVVKSRSVVGEITRALEQVPCFATVTPGRITEVGEGKKQFALTIDTTCF